MVLGKEFEPEAMNGYQAKKGDQGRDIAVVRDSVLVAKTDQHSLVGSQTIVWLLLLS